MVTSQEQTETIVTRYADAAEFLAVAEPYLLEDEARNSLLLWAARARLRHGSPGRRRPVLFSLAFSAGRPIAAGVMANSRKLLLAGNVPGIQALAVDLAATHPALPYILGPSETTQAFAEIWRAITGTRSDVSAKQRLHAISHVIYPPDLPQGLLRSAEVSDQDFLSRWLMDFQIETHPGEAGDLDATRIIVNQLTNNRDLFVFQLEDGWVVSMASRARPLVRGVSVGLNYTPLESRLHGYATACIVHLSSSLLESGYEFCTLLTDRTSTITDHLYTKIGYRPIADFDEVRFREGHG